MDNKRILSEEFTLEQLSQDEQNDSFMQPVQTLSQVQGFNNTMRVMPTGEDLARIDNLLQSISADAHDSNMFVEEQPVYEDVKMEPDYVKNAILSFEEELIRKLNAKSKPEVKITPPKEPVCVESTISSITDLLCEFSKEVEKTNIFSDEPVRFNPPSNILVRVNLPKKPQQTQSNFNFSPTIEITKVPPIEDFVPVPSNKPQKPKEPMFVQTTFGVDNKEEFTLGQQQPQAQPQQYQQTPQPQRRGLDMSDIYAREMEYQRKLEEEENKKKPTITMVSSFEAAPTLDLYSPVEEEKSVGMQVSFTSDIEHDLLDSTDIYDEVPVMNNDINYDDLIGDMLDGKVVDPTPLIEEEPKIEMIQSVPMDSSELTLSLEDFNEIEETPELINQSFDDFPLLDEEPKVTMTEQTLPEALVIDDLFAKDEELLAPIYEEVKEETQEVNSIEEPVKQEFERVYNSDENEFVLGVSEYVEKPRVVTYRNDTYEQPEQVKEFDRVYQSNENEFVLGQEEVKEQPKAEVGFGKDFDEPIQEEVMQFERVFTPSSDEFVLGAPVQKELLSIDDVADKEVFTSQLEEQVSDEPKLISIVNFNPRDDYQTISPKNCMDMDDEPVVTKVEVSPSQFIPRDYSTISAKDCMDMDEVTPNVVKRVVKRTTITTTTKPKEYNLENILFNVEPKETPVIEQIETNNEEYNLTGIFDDNEFYEDNNINQDNIIEDNLTTSHLDVEPKETFDLSGLFDDEDEPIIEENIQITESQLDEESSQTFDLTGIFDDEEVIETKENISVLDTLVEEQVESYNLAGIFDEEEYEEPALEVIHEEPTIEVVEEYHEEVLEPGDMTLSFDDFYNEANESSVEDTFEQVEEEQVQTIENVNNVEPTPLTEEYDLTGLFDEIEEQQTLDIEVDEFDGLFDEVVEQQLVYQNDFNLEETEENPDQITLCNVYDNRGEELNKDDFIQAFVNGCNVYDINGNKFDKENLINIIDQDLLIVCDRFGIKTNKLVLLRDLASAEKQWEKDNEVVSNIFNEFNKPVSKDELVKEYHNNDPHLYDAYRTKLNKENIIELISTGELVIGEFGKEVNKSELIELLKDNRTSVFNRYNEELTQEKLVQAVRDGADIYDKYENHLTNVNLCIKIDNNLLDIKNEKGIKVSKEELLRTVFGFLDVFNANRERMTKRVLVMYLNDKNLNIYNKNGVLLTKAQIIKLMNANDITMTAEHKILLLGVNSNVFDEEGNHLNKQQFISEYRNVLPRIFDIDGKKINKDTIIEGIKDETIIIVDKKEVVNKDELINELQLNLYGIFSKDNEELTQEELIECVHTNQLYDFKGKVINKKDLIKKIIDSELIVYDINGNQSDIDTLVSELKKQYIGVYDFFHNQLTKEELISHLNANNKALFDDTKTLLSNDEINQLLISNNIDVTKYEQFFQTRNDKRDFLDINQEDNFVYTGDEYMETPNIVLARKDEDRLVIVSYNESFEARLNMTDDIIKDLYTLLKNKILSYNKVKGKINWNYESFTHGKFQFAKIDIEDDKIYLFLPLNWNDFINTKYKYKDCSNKKNFEVTCLRFRITSLSELRDCFELIELIASHIHTTEIKDFVKVNYYEKNRGFEQLLREDLIKEVVNSKKFSNLVEIDKTSLINNDITSINVSVIKDIPINEELYKDVTSKISKVEGRVNKCIVTIDTISKMYHHDEVVSLESLKAKNIISNSVTFVKCIARGSLDKKLVFELQDYSKDAIKMILLTNSIIK